MYNNIGDATMNTIFLCNKCGNILNISKFDIIHKTISCNCGERITIENSYPGLQANDLIFSADSIYNQCIEQDQKCKDKYKLWLRKTNVTIEKDKINVSIQIYDKIRENYKDNDRNENTIMFDELEKELQKQGFNDIQIDGISSALYVGMNNQMRKPFIIICASVIEILFNDFFNCLINCTFKDNGAKILKKQYSKIGVSQCIIIANGFLNNLLDSKVNSISKDFMSRWEKLRNFRNEIIHNNSTYITRQAVEDNFNLLNESIKVFSNLKSNILSNKYNNVQKVL